MSRTKKQAIPAPKKRLTLLDLQPQPYKLTLKHPEIADLELWVMIQPRENSLEYTLKSIEFGKRVLEFRELYGENMESIPASAVQAQWEWAAELASLIISDWDAEVVGAPYDRELCKTLLSSPNNFWIRFAVENALADQTNFFKKA